MRSRAAPFFFLRPDMPEDGPLQFTNGRDLSLLERVLKHSPIIPDKFCKEGPEFLQSIIDGTARGTGDRAPSMSARMKAVRLMDTLYKSALAAARLELDAWKAQQPGQLSMHSLANVVEKISQIAQDKFGDTPAAQEFRDRLITEVLHEARMEQGTTLLPGEVDGLVQAMDDTIPDTE